MTIVVGFPGIGVPGYPNVPYVVLGADSEEGEWPSKASVPKIAVIEKESLKCLIAGAGSGTFIDLAVQEIEAALTPPFSLATVRQTMEDVVTEIYVKRIKTYPRQEQSQYDFELLCGVWAAGESVHMLSVGRAYNLVRKAPEAIGVGRYLARYIIATYHLPIADLYHSCRLVTYLLSQVKQHAAACGGASHIAWLDGNGRGAWLPEATMLEHERSTALVISGAKWMLHFVDPMGWGGDLDKVDRAIETGTQHMKDDIRRFWSPPPGSAPTGGGLLSPPPTTPDASGPPPSPGSGESPSPAS